MLKDYLNQNVVLCHRTGTNQRGQPVFSESVTVPCRIQKKHTLIQKSDSEIVSAEYVCYLTDEVKTGDKINGFTILSVSNMVDLNGEIIGFRAVI